MANQRRAVWSYARSITLDLCTALEPREIPANLDFALQFGEHTGVNPIATGRRSRAIPLSALP